MPNSKNSASKYADASLRRRAISLAVIIWCSFCILSNSVAAICNFLVALASSENIIVKSFGNPGIMVFGELGEAGRGKFGVLGLLAMGMVLGNLLTMFGKKTGFYIIYVSSLYVFLLNLSISLYYGLAGLISALLYIIVTWVFIRKAWKFFD